MPWENQYMRLVETKPGVIASEISHESTPELKNLLISKKATYEKTYVELGCGSGMHLLSLAAQNPSVLCVGFEIRFKRAFKTGEKAESLGLGNVLVLRGDARKIGDLFSASSVDGFFINYPDPWEKRRWRKHRLLSQELLLALHTTLAPGGILRYKTDHHEYFSSVIPLLTSPNWAIGKQTRDLVHSEYMEGNISTEFEQLFRSQAQPLCMVEARKLSLEP